MTILYFFGPDGSGKSTLTRALSQKLNERGCKVKLSWMRGSHTLTSVMANFLSRFELFKGTENPYFNIKIPKKMKSFWQFLEFLSALPVIFFRFIFPSSMGYWILADRYTLDLVVWICLTTDDPEFLKKFLAKILISLSSKTRAKFYVFANIEDLNKRTTDKIWFPSEQLMLYRKLAKAIDAQVINTSIKSVNESIEQVMQIID